jgi:hypothetical protein
MYIIRKTSRQMSSGARIALAHKGRADSALNRMKYTQNPREYFAGYYQRVYRQLYTRTCMTVSGDKVSYRISLNGPVSYTEEHTGYTRDFYRHSCVDYDYIGNIAIAIRHKLWVGDCKSKGDYCECTKEEDKSPTELIEKVVLEIGGCVVDVLEMGIYPDILNSKVSYSPYQTNIPLYMTTIHRNNLLPISRIMCQEVVLKVDCVEGVFPLDVQLYGSCYYTRNADNLYGVCQLTYQYQYSNEFVLKSGRNEMDLSFCNPTRSIQIHGLDKDSVTYIGLFFNGKVFVEGGFEMFEHYKTVDEEEDSQVGSVVISFSNELNNPYASVNFSCIDCVKLVIHRVPGIYWVPHYHACDCCCDGVFDKGVPVNIKKGEEETEKDQCCEKCREQIKEEVSITVSTLSYQLVAYREGYVDFMFKNPNTREESSE